MTSTLICPTSIVSSRSRGSALMLVLSLALAFAMMIPHPEAVCAESAAKRRVLILHSYHETSEWTDEIQHGIRTVLTRSPFAPEMHVAYMDAQRYSASRLEDDLENLYATKYREMAFDVVIVSDDPALDFILPRRERLFPGVPLVFCGINDFQPERIKGQAQITGVNQDVDVRKTVDLAVRLLPGMEKMIVISDRTPTGLANTAKFHRDTQNHPSGKPVGKPAFELIDDATVAALRHRLAALSDDSAVLVLRLHQTGEGRILSPAEYLQLVVGACNVPVFKLWGPYFDDDVLGGVMVSGRSQGELAAGMALRILGG